MLRNPWGHGALVGIVSIATAVSAHAQAPTVAQLLAYRPTQKGVEVSTPTAAEQAQCQVEAQGGNAWVLKDPQGRLLRKFGSSRGRSIDQWSYFKDGREVYREVDTTGTKNRPDKFIWMGLGGMKIGVDRTGNGAIDQWLAISPEELSQEVLRSLVDKDWTRFKALLISEEELKSLGAPEREVARIRDLQKDTASRFQQVAARFANLNENTRWLHFEAGVPARLLAEVTGMKDDAIMYFRGLILAETAGKTDSIQLGEIVQVGEAWKLLDAPLAAEAAGPVAFQSTQSPSPAAGGDPAMNALLEKLAEIDKQPPTTAGPAAIRYHQERVGILKQIVAAAPAAERIAWYKQLVDSLNGGAQAGDEKALAELKALGEQLTKQQPTSPLTGYVLYRVITTEYSMQMHKVAKPEDQLALQNKYVEGLKAFVTAHPKADDAAEALLQLGMISEFQAKDDEAKTWYGHLVRDFASSRQAAKGAGALRRLNLVGQTWELGTNSAPLAGQTLTPAALQGKTVIVYYWASWCQGCVQDLTRLGALKQTYGDKGLEIVTINLDDQPATAREKLQQAGGKGIHVHVVGGLDSQAVIQYGMVIFPQMYLVNNKGVVANSNLDLSEIEEELKKLGF